MNPDLGKMPGLEIQRMRGPWSRPEPRVNSHGRRLRRAPRGAELGASRSRCGGWLGTEEETSPGGVGEA